MTEDQRAREVIDSYVETVTGITPEQRKLNHLRNTMRQLRRVMQGIGGKVSNLLERGTITESDMETPR